MGRMSRRLALLACLAAIPAVIPWAAPQAQKAASSAPAVEGAAAMAAHRGAYTLTLARARDSGDVAQASGAMLFEVTDACEGWATRQRLTMTLISRSGEQLETSSEYATYETKDGRSLRFSMVQSSQGAVSQRVSGEAELQADGSGVVRYVEPEAKQERLPPGTLLPMIHTIRTLAAARSGRKIMVAPLFDGTNDDGAQDSTTIIAGTDPARANERFPALSSLASARMRIAFFGRDAQQGSQGGGAAQPDYEVGLRYFDNGVADDMAMDFGDFVMDAKLSKLELLPGGC
jgi:hypothetical protein